MNIQTGVNIQPDPATQANVEAKYRAIQTLAEAMNRLASAIESPLTLVSHCTFNFKDHKPATQGLETSDE